MSEGACRSHHHHHHTPSAWLREYQTLDRHQEELESAVSAILATSSPSGIVRPASSSSQSAILAPCSPEVSSEREREVLLEANRTANAEQREAQERYRDHVNMAKSAMRNGLLGVRYNSTLLDPAAASPSAALTAQTKAKERARADYRGLLTAIRGSMRAEGERLAKEEEPLESVSEEAARMLDGHQRGPLRRPTAAAVVDGPRAVYTGGRGAEGPAAKESDYAAFLAENGGPTLGWPEELHSAFCRIAQSVQQTGRARGRSGVEDAAGEDRRLFLSAPQPPAPSPLLEAAKAWLYTVVAVPEIERHVELYTRQQELLQACGKAEGQPQPAQASQASYGRGNKRSCRGLAALGGEQGHSEQAPLPVAVCAVPWERARANGPIGVFRCAGYEDPDVQAAIAAKLRDRQRAQQQQAERRRRVEAWRAQRAAEEERLIAARKAMAAEEQRIRKASFRVFQQEQRRGNRLGLQPRSPAQGNSRAEGVGEGQAEKAPAEERRAARRMLQEALAERRRRDVEEVKARREWVAAVRRYEAQSTKAAVSERYYRAMASAHCHGGDEEGSRFPAEPLPASADGQRFLRSTATHTQHVLPDWENVRLEQTMGQRARWLSPAAQESYQSLPPNT